MYVQWMKPLDNISTLDELTILISTPPPPPAGCFGNYGTQSPNFTYVWGI